jgi:hypothetical protein
MRDDGNDDDDSSWVTRDGDEYSEQKMNIYGA